MYFWKSDQKSSMLGLEETAIEQESRRESEGSNEEFQDFGFKGTVLPSQVEPKWFKRTVPLNHSSCAPSRDSVLLFTIFVF